MSRDCPIKTILAVVGFAASAGVPPPDLLRAAGLDPTELADPDAYLLRAQEMRLWDEALRLTGDQDFGLHLAEWVARFPLDHFDVLAFAGRSSPTRSEPFCPVGRYIRLIHEGIRMSLELELEEKGDVVRLVQGHTPRADRTATAGGRHAGADVPARAPGHRVSEQERAFRAPVHQGCACNELGLDRALQDRSQRPPCSAMAPPDPRFWRSRAAGIGRERETGSRHSLGPFTRQGRSAEGPVGAAARVPLGLRQTPRH